MLINMIKIPSDKHAAALAALYNNSQPLGMGILHYTPEVMTEEEAAQLLEKYKYFDYLKGRVMKVRIGDDIDPRLYDRDNGEGAAEAALRSAGIIE